jgi:hypothetical protein
MHGSSPGKAGFGQAGRLGLEPGRQGREGRQKAAYRLAMLAVCLSLSPWLAGMALEARHCKSRNGKELRKENVAIDDKGNLGYASCVSVKSFEVCAKLLQLWEGNNMEHYAALYRTRYGLAGVVLSFASETSATGTLNTQRPLTGKDYDAGKEGRVGYVGCSSFEEAVKRAGMMERSEPGAWGPLPI